MIFSLGVDIISEIFKYLYTDSFIYILERVCRNFKEISRRREYILTFKTKNLDIEKIISIYPNLKRIKLDIQGDVTKNLIPTRRLDHLKLEIQTQLRSSLSDRRGNSLYQIMKNCLNFRISIFTFGSLVQEAIRREDKVFFQFDSSGITSAIIPPFVRFLEEEQISNFYLFASRGSSFFNSLWENLFVKVLTVIIVDEWDYIRYSSITNNPLKRETTRIFVYKRCIETFLKLQKLNEENSFGWEIIRYKTLDINKETLQIDYQIYMD